MGRLVPIHWCDQINDPKMPTILLVLGTGMVRLSSGYWEDFSNVPVWPNKMLISKNTSNIAYVSIGVVCRTPQNGVAHSKKGLVKYN